MDAVDFYFDFLSPYSYLAHSQLPTLGAPVRYVPIAVLDVMKIVNNAPTTMTCSAKRNYAGKDIGRWAARYGVPFGMADFQRLDGGLLLRIATAAKRMKLEAEVTAAIFKAVWGNAGDASPAGIAATLSANGLPADALIKGAAAEETAQALAATVDEAAGLGVFGAPTFRVGADLYFGNDRFDFIREALATQKRSAS